MYVNARNILNGKTYVPIKLHSVQMTYIAQLYNYRKIMHTKYGQMYTFRPCKLLNFVITNLINIFMGKYDIWI